MRWGRLLLVAALLAASVVSGESSPGLYNSVRERTDNPSRNPEAVSHFEKLLQEVEDRAVEEDDLSSATALLRTITNLSYAVGPTIGGVLLVIG